MKFTVITLFPEMIENVLAYGVIGKAIEKKLIEKMRLRGLCGDCPQRKCAK